MIDQTQLLNRRLQTARRVMNERERILAEATSARTGGRPGRGASADRSTITPSCWRPRTEPARWAEAQRKPRRFAPGRRYVRVLLTCESPATHGAGSKGLDDLRGDYEYRSPGGQPTDGRRESERQMHDSLPTPRDRNGTKR